MDTNWQSGVICRKSRERAGIDMDQAAELINSSCRMLSRYEYGESTVPEDKILKMSEIYQDPLLPWNYWASTSLIAQHYGIKPMPDIDFPTVALRVIRGVHMVSKEKDICTEILGDAVIDRDELPKFTELVNEIEEISREMTFLKLTSQEKVKEKTTFAEAV